MQAVEIKGNVRTTDGKGGARRVRAEGLIPGVLYGAGERGVPITLNYREFEGILRKHGSETFVLDLKLPGREAEEMKTIIKELQRDPVSSRILHVDLQHVQLTQMVHVSVPLHIVGTPAGVKEGGLLEIACRDIEVECQAGQIPERIDVDVTDLTKGHSIHVRDLALPGGITVLTAGERVVATIVAKAAEVEAPAEAPAPAAEEGKKEGEETPPAKA
jgi:large subunit ribosomal protein L25